MSTNTIKQSITFSASAWELYEAIIDAKKHAAFTGGAARISATVGGAFSVYDGYATGKNLALVPGKKIVQTWRAEDWPEGVVSKITFLFSPFNRGTKLTFTQTGVPANQYDAIAMGWYEHYWNKMKAAGY